MMNEISKNKFGLQVTNLINHGRFVNKEGSTYAPENQERGIALLNKLVEDKSSYKVHENVPY